jgi:hypothetical protein
LGDVEAAEAVFISYLAVPILIAFWVIGYAWTRTLPEKPVRSTLTQVASLGSLSRRCAR